MGCAPPRLIVSPGLPMLSSTAPSSTSSAVMTASTPGMASASVASMRSMRAWACGLRTMAACAISGRVMSAMNVPPPRSRRSSSKRGMLRPV